MCLKNPSRFYGLGDDTIYMFFFNLTLKLSERTAYSRFQRAIQSSPWFLARGTISGKKYLEYVPNKNIRFDKGSNLQHALGSACMYCLDGNTKILTNMGPEYIKNLVGKPIQVYTKDKNNNISLTDNVEVIETKKVTELYEIELEDGFIFRCTPEHKVMLVNGEYKEVQDLTLNDEIYTINTNCGIYRLYNSKTNKSYIGQSQNLKTRLYQHLHSPIDIINEDIEKYGKEYYHFEILEYCSPEVLDDRERYYINKYNSLLPNGYNQYTGGKQNGKACDELKQRLKTLPKTYAQLDAISDRFWVNDGIDNYFVKSDEYKDYINDGYKEGKVYLKKKAGGISEN